MSNEHACNCGGPAAETLSLNAGAAGSASTTLRVEGMDCADEVAALERALRPLAGVREVRVNLMASRVTIWHDETVTPGALIDAIAAEGLKAVPEAAVGDSETRRRTRWRELAVAVSGSATGLGLLAQAAGWPFAAAAFAVGIVAGAWFTVPKAWRAARRGALDMNVLMTVAVAGAAGIGEWPEGAAVAFLFALSELLEAASLTRARRAVQALMALAPQTASVKEADGSWRERPAAEVSVGSTIAVRSGGRIALDGVVTAGESAIDQAPITGEAMPVSKGPGDPVFAGTINGDGALEVRTTRPAGDTVIARILHLVEEAQSRKAPTQRFVDRFARVYTPAVIAAAVAVMIFPPLAGWGGWLTWFYRGLVLLVIACPCALVIATPVSIVSALTALARRGVLVKGGAALEALGQLRALAVDKTGTITEGKPRVTEIVSLGGLSEEELLKVAAGIETHSHHPLARAVVAQARERGIPFERSGSYLARNGRGAEAEIGGHAYFVGNHRFAHELGVCTPEVEARLEAVEAAAQSVIVIGHKPHGDCAGEVLGILAVGDAIRPGAAEAVAALHRAGVRRVVLLSGDNQRTVDAFARQAGIDEAHGELLPEQKVREVEAMLEAGPGVGMIGDGVNDAPAMAAATLGIAMGRTGTDAALETADVALMQDDLGKVAEAIALSRRTLRVIQFNIAFALALKAVFLVLAVTGAARLWLAILADTGATLLVIANALRLLRSRK